MARWQTTTPAPTQGRADAGFEKTWTLEFLTPVFGGGVLVHPEPDHPDRIQRKLLDRRHDKRPDPVTPVRPSAIRGQLRFWWRAAIGSRMDSIHQMRDQEAALFGSTGRRSRVEIRVESQPSCTAIDVFYMHQPDPGPDGRPKPWNPRSMPGKEDLAYACFPLQPPGSLPQPLEPGKVFEVKGRFRLTLRYDATAATDPEEDWKQVQRSVETWLAFGGLGGRTRRGFGALRGGTWSLPELLDGFRSKRRGAGQRFALEHTTTSLPGVPSLSAGHCATRPEANAARAHEVLLRKLKALRQGPELGRDPGTQPNRPKRSRWPEPDEIRRLTGQHSNGHDPKHPVRAFPRGEFGMPIIFHFKREKPNPDPSDTTLKPCGRDSSRRQLERLASPLILRPWQHPTSGQVHALALVLGDPARASLEGTLSGNLMPGASGDNLQIRLTAAQASWPNSPLNGEPNPLLAFLDYFLE